MIDLEIYNDTKFLIPEKIFKKITGLVNTKFQKVFPPEIDRQKKYLITCTFVDDQVIQKINKDQRGIDKPTDVVSLSYLGKEFPGQDMVGEIYISVETAVRQAKDQIHDLNTELKFLFIHGVLHILGYEHKSEEDFKTMMDMTNQILGIQND